MLVGRNGLGKTTLLKALLAERRRTSASSPVGPRQRERAAGATKSSIGYFPQDHTGAIQKGLTAVEWLHQFDPDASRQDIHGLLGQMLFSGEEGLKPTEALSGGETARLLFCRIMLQKPNVLVLDEPTNHLDLESINALNIALQKFEGTVLLVTHDQDLMEEVGTRVWHFEPTARRSTTSRAPTRSTARRSPDDALRGLRRLISLPPGRFEHPACIESKQLDCSAPANGTGIDGAFLESPRPAGWD